MNESNLRYQTELETMKNKEENQPAENRQLKVRINELEHTIQQLQNETETIGRE